MTPPTLGTTRNPQNDPRNDRQTSPDAAGNLTGLGVSALSTFSSPFRRVLAAATMSMVLGGEPAQSGGTDPNKSSAATSVETPKSADVVVAKIAELRKWANNPFNQSNRNSLETVANATEKVLQDLAKARHSAESLTTLTDRPDVVETAKLRMKEIDKAFRELSNLATDHISATAPRGFDYSKFGEPFKNLLAPVHVEELPTRTLPPSMTTPPAATSPDTAAPLDFAVTSARLDKIPSSEAINKAMEPIKGFLTLPISKNSEMDQRANANLEYIVEDVNSATQRLLALRTVRTEHLKENWTNISDAEKREIIKQVEAIDQQMTSVLPGRITQALRVSNTPQKLYDTKPITRSFLLGSFDKELPVLGSVQGEQLKTGKPLTFALFPGQEAILIDGKNNEIAQLSVTHNGRFILERTSKTSAEFPRFTFDEKTKKVTILPPDHSENEETYTLRRQDSSRLADYQLAEREGVVDETFTIAKNPRAIAPWDLAPTARELAELEHGMNNIDGRGARSDFLHGMGFTPRGGQYQKPSISGYGSYEVADWDDKATFKIKSGTSTNERKTPEEQATAEAMRVKAMLKGLDGAGNERYLANFFKKEGDTYARPSADPARNIIVSKNGADWQVLLQDLPAKKESEVIPSETPAPRPDPAARVSARIRKALNETPDERKHQYLTDNGFEEKNSVYFKAGQKGTQFIVVFKDSDWEVKILNKAVLEKKIGELDN